MWRLPNLYSLGKHMWYNLEWKGGRALSEDARGRRALLHRARQAGAPAHPVVPVPAALAAWSFPVAGKTDCLAQMYLQSNVHMGTFWVLSKNLGCCMALVSKLGSVNCFTGAHQTEQSTVVWLPQYLRRILVSLRGKSSLFPCWKGLKSSPLGRTVKKFLQFRCIASFPINVSCYVA